MAHNLADEIWATILKTILNVPDDDFISYKTSLGPFSHRDYSNADVLLVCKRWLRIATPLVFHTCIIRSTAQAQALAKALKKNPEFGSLIKQLRLEGCYGASVPNILEKATRLEDLAISLPINSKDNGKPMFAILGSLTPRRLIVCNSPKNSGCVQATFALTALQNFMKTCSTLNAVVLSLPLIRSISSELSASPSSIFNLSTWNQFISEFDYETVSDLFKTLKSLCRVELLVPRLQYNVRQPSDENLTKIGERTIFRAWGKECGITLGEHFTQGNERQLAAMATFMPSSTTPVLSHAPEPLRYTVWTHVLRHACEQNYPRYCRLSLVCHMFLDICTRHRLRNMTLLGGSEAARTACMLKRAVATNPTAGSVARRLHLGDAKLNGSMHAASIQLLRSVVIHCSQLTVVECFRMSIELFYLLASASNQSLLEISFQGACEEHSRTGQTVVYLPSLRRFKVGTSTDHTALASDWRSVVIQAPALLNLELDDWVNVSSLMPSFIRGQLSQLRRLTMSQPESPLTHLENCRTLIIAHGARVTECTVPMSLVASVFAHCTTLERLVICAAHPSTLDHWSQAFQIASPLTHLRHLTFHEALLTRAPLDPELETVPDIFGRNLFPVLNDIQIRSLYWPQISSLQHEPKVALAIAWSERFADVGIRVVDELGHKWRPRLATTQSRGRQAKRAR